jgi:hypothetical protein
MAESGDRSFAARVAQATGGTDRRGARIVRIGDGELGGAEDRLAARCAELGGRLREACVLAFVIRDDPLETVVRGTRAATKYRAPLMRIT